MLQVTLRAAKRAGAVAAGRSRAAELETAARRALDVKVTIPYQSAADTLRFFAFDWSAETGVLTSELDGWLTTVERLDRPEDVQRAAEAVRLAAAAQSSEVTARSRGRPKACWRAAGWTSRAEDQTRVRPPAPESPV